MSWVLVIYIYAGMWAKGDSVTITTIPMASVEACQTAGKDLGSLVDGSSKVIRYACVKNH